MDEYDRTERRILGFVAGVAIVAGVAVLAALGITAWVIIRVTLHFT